MTRIAGAAGASTATPTRWRVIANISGTTRKDRRTTDVEVAATPTPLIAPATPASHCRRLETSDIIYACAPADGDGSERALACAGGHGRGVRARGLASQHRREVRLDRISGVATR